MVGPPSPGIKRWMLTTPPCWVLTTLPPPIEHLSLRTECRTVTHKQPPTLGPDSISLMARRRLRPPRPDLEHQEGSTMTGRPLGDAGEAVRHRVDEARVVECRKKAWIWCDQVAGSTLPLWYPLIVCGCLLCQSKAAELSSAERKALLIVKRRGGSSHQCISVSKLVP